MLDCKITSDGSIQYSYTECYYCLLMITASVNICDLGLEVKALLGNVYLYSRSYQVRE